MKRVGGWGLERVCEVWGDHEDYEILRVKSRDIRYKI